MGNETAAAEASLVRTQSAGKPIKMSPKNRKEGKKCGKRRGKIELTSIFTKSQSKKSSPGSGLVFKSFFMGSGKAKQ